MAKKNSSQRKKKANKPKHIRVVYHSAKNTSVEKALIENFIGLQKVMVNLSEKFDSLAGQISKLLELFDISAKSLARKDFSTSDNAESKKIIEKLDNLSMQAGLIGKGLALIHEIGAEKGRPLIPINIQENKPKMPAPPSLNQASPEPHEKMTKELEGFEKSSDTGSKE